MTASSSELNSQLTGAASEMPKAKLDRKDVYKIVVDAVRDALDFPTQENLAKGEEFQEISPDTDVGALLQHEPEGPMYALAILRRIENKCGLQNGSLEALLPELMAGSTVADFQQAAGLGYIRCMTIVDEDLRALPPVEVGGQMKAPELHKLPADTVLGAQRLKDLGGSKPLTPARFTEVALRRMEQEAA
jgi:hypothetical protein